MYDNSKIWSIELGEDLEVTAPDRKPSPAPTPRPIGPERTAPRKTKPAPRPQPTVASAEPARPGLQFAPLVLLSYLLGPLAIVLTPEGRRSRRWVGAGIFFAIAWVALAVGGGSILGMLSEGALTAPWLVFLVLALAGGFTVWARALGLAGGRHRPTLHRMPLLLRRPWSAGILNCLAPGLALLVGGRPWSAGAVLWSFWAATAGLVTLVGARRVTTSNADAGMVFRPSVAFEIMLMTATVLVCGGFLVWLIQSLAGFGRIVPEVALRRRPRADRLALVLMGTLLVFVFAWDPPTVGGALHGRALAWQQDGYRVIPLALSLAARKCDPTGVDYAVTAIELNRELGRDEAAAALRADLDRQLASYLALRRKEEARAQVTSAAVPRETAPPAGEAALGFGQGLSVNWPRSDASSASEPPAPQATP